MSIFLQQTISSIPGVTATRKVQATALNIGDKATITFQLTYWDGLVQYTTGMLKPTTIRLTINNNIMHNPTTGAIVLSGGTGTLALLTSIAQIGGSLTISTVLLAWLVQKDLDGAFTT